MSRLAWAGLLSVLAAAVALFLGCGSSETAGETELLDSTGTAQGYVYVPSVAHRADEPGEMILVDEPTDDESLAPVEGATVVLENGTSEQTTDASGKFSFDDVPLADEEGIDVGIFPPESDAQRPPLMERILVRQRLRTGVGVLPIPPDIDRTQLVVVPRQRVVPTGGKVQFRAAAIRPMTRQTMQRHVVVIPPDYLSWSVEGVGSIAQDSGLYSAGTTVGSAVITAAATIPPDADVGRTEQIVLTGEARVRVVDRARLAVATGTVTGNNDKPFVGALVQAVVMIDDTPRPIPGAAVVKADGTYTLRHLPSGIPLLLVCIYGVETGQVATQSATLDPGVNSNIDFEIAEDVPDATLDRLGSRLDRFPGHPERHYSPPES